MARTIRKWNKHCNCKKCKWFSEKKNYEAKHDKIFYDDMLKNGRVA